MFVLIVCALLAFAPSAIFAQVNGERHHPYFGWSSFSEQTLNSTFLTQTNITVPYSGAYQLEIDYQTSGQRSYFMTVNNGVATDLDLNGNTFNDPTASVIKVQLQAGTNTIQFGNPTGYSPDLDRIVVAPASNPTNATEHTPFCIADFW